jgi:transcriptional regulator with XRE-family HTH domain
MGKRKISFVFAYRKRWGLTQPQLAKLVSLASPSAISRIERSKRNPTAATLIALSIVFGLPLPDLLASLYDDIEETVVTAAKEILDDVSGRTDKDSVLARTLMEDVLARIISRSRSPKDI